MKFGVVIFPGSNCDEDMIHVLGEVMGHSVERLWHKDKDLKGCDFIVLPGGFSYGDYLRSGAIARFSPIMEEVIQHAKKGGYLMGICNGFQILAEAGLVPGILLRNKNQKFVCQNTFIKAESQNSLLTRNLKKGEVLKIPVAHAEGRFFAVPDEIKRLEDQGQVLFRYCNEQGELTEEANFNGSSNHIAGICNTNRNVFGMMPHPERAADSVLANTDGLKIFESITQLV